MQVAVHGAGYVGLVTAVCLAELGHTVICVEIDKRKCASLNAGDPTHYEIGLSDILRRNIKDGRLSFFSTTNEQVMQCAVQFITVGTPADEDGSASLRYVTDCATTIAHNLHRDTIIVLKSTVPVGTCQQITQLVDRIVRAKRPRVSFRICVNPEFLREGVALEDFMSPDRIVVGVDEPGTADVMRALYAPIIKRAEQWQVYDTVSAELVKYASNAMLATKISFINEISRVAEAVGADIQHVRQGMSLDKRIGPHFISPGCGYGGSCFPKDVQALIQSARHFQLDMSLLEAVERVNHRQKHVLFNKLLNHFGHSLAGKTIAVWGLSFKPQTDDVREATSAVVIDALCAHGVHVQAYDPAANASFAHAYPHLTIHFGTQADSVLEGAVALVICTEWPEFIRQDPAHIASYGVKAVFDGRNCLEPKHISQHMVYYGIGR